MAETLYVLAEVAGRRVAVDAAQIDSVVDLGSVVPTPGAAPEILGLAALRSRVVTVVNSWAMLGLPMPDERPNRALIVRDDAFDYAVLVDMVKDVAPFAAQPVSSGTVLGPGWDATAIGVIEHEGEPLLVVDLCRLLPRGATITAAA